MGLWSWQNVDGKCVRSDKDVDEKYADVAYNDLYKRFRETTSSWAFMRTTATTAIYIAWLLTIWLLVFSCIPFSVRMRNVLGLLLIVALSTSQAPVLNVKYTDFCKVHGCQAGESWDFSIAAMTLVTIAGVMLILSNNDRRREQQRLRNLALNGAAASRDGLNIAEEVPVESGLIDLSLIDPAAAAAAAEVEGGR
jgi:hypothetical protein